MKYNQRYHTRFFMFLAVCMVHIGAINIFAVTPEDILNYVSNTNANISLYYENLETGEKITYNEDEVFKAASTIKLPLITYVYELASQGKLDLDSLMTYTSGYYYEGSGVIRYEPVGSTYTLRDLAEKSIVHSDNIAYSMLRNKVGEENFKNYLRAAGGKLVDTSGYRTMDVIDFSKYIKDYYYFTLENPSLGAELTHYWQNTVFTEHIPAGVPDLATGHKIGWLPMEKVYHDGGIVYHDQPYVLVILSKGLDTTPQKAFFSNLTSKINTYHNDKYIASEMLKKEQQEKYLKDNTLPLDYVANNMGWQLDWSPKQGVAVVENESIKLYIDAINAVCSVNDIEVNDAFIYYEDTIYLTKTFVSEHIYQKLRESVEEVGGKIIWHSPHESALCLVEDTLYIFDTSTGQIFKDNELIDSSFLYEKGVLYIPIVNPSTNQTDNSDVLSQ